MLYANTKYGFVSLVSGAGASFLTASMAGYLAARGQKPAVLELGKGTLYDSLGLQRHFLYKGYESPYDVVKEDGNIREIANMYKGINWAVQTTGSQSESIEFPRQIRLIHNLQGDTLLCDFSGRRVEGEGSECTWHLFREMDRLFVIIDPLPSKLLRGAALLARFRLSKLPVTYVINKNNTGVNHHELKEYLGLSKYITVPYMEAEWIYTAEYHCKDPYSVKGIADTITPALDRLTGHFR